VKRASKKISASDAAAAASSSIQRFVCIHGHFYQPPRENPWLETVEAQDSAAPYHDWNDRITAECYAPNGASRITNKQDEIIRIMNNYARMSFNFGPTLLSWLEDKAPRTYRMIVDADKFSAQRYSGHGSAVAQAYNHMIMPLASRRDAITQIRWGIADFESRFGHKPEGMWLAETAVNRSVLDLMAQEGIKFTILAPLQCARVRKIAPETYLSPETSSLSPASSSPAQPSLPSASPLSPSECSLSPSEPSSLSSRSAADGSASLPSAEAQTEIPWSQTPSANVDPTHPYLVNLDDGRTIAVFFYDGPSSRAIAFEGLLNSGENFGSRLLSGFHPISPGDPEVAQLSHVATDGESYGHHHKHGEMALSYAMHWIEEGKQAKLTNYGEFLERFPPKWEAEVAEDTSWSCAHGVERWRSNCGCNGGKAGWNQEWRAPLRESLDYLRDTTAPLAEQLAAGLLKDLWAARDAYIHVVLNRSPATIIRFFADHAARHLSEAERTTALELMELERHAQLMYTSCGWFFDEVSGIETIQIIAYAGRVLQLAAKLFGEPGAALEPKFLEILARAKSNVPEMGDGAEVYRRYVTGMRIGLEQVGAHYAISSIFRNYPEHGELFCFDVHRESQEIFNSGRGRVALGRALVYSRITEENEEICFAVLHLGDQNLSAAVRAYNSLDQAEVEAFAAFSTDISTAIRRANLPEVIRLIDRFFGETAYSLTSLFADEQHRILSGILNQTVSEMEDSLRKIYDDHASLMHFLTESGMTAPPALATAARFAINASLRRAFESDQFDPKTIELFLSRATSDQIPIDAPLLGYTVGQRMKRAMISLEAAAAGDSTASDALATALVVAETIHKMPFEVNIWQAQNIWNDLLRRSDTNYWTDEWKEGFKKLGETMNIKVDQLVIEDGVSAF
jgi:alpha-amylase/alpha-mannosidase (GH57 family)